LNLYSEKNKMGSEKENNYQKMKIKNLPKIDWPKENYGQITKTNNSLQM